MFFPSNPTWRNTMHGQLQKGGYVYGYTDETGYAVRTVRVEQRGAMERQTYRHAALPQQVFTSVPDMAQALAPVTDEQFADELATWPRITQSEKCSTVTRCMECAESGRYTLYVHRNWCDGVRMNLCRRHAVGSAAELLARFDVVAATRRKNKLAGG